jgi:CheY-like chemotaxis protein/signal transduction histidine kinase
MKTDLFLRSILVKIILISFCSLLLLAVLLYIHFRVIKVKTKRDLDLGFSEDILSRTIDLLPFGMIFIHPGGKIHLLNQAAEEMLDLDRGAGDLSIEDLGLDESSVSMEDSVYRRTFGPGSLLILRRGALLKYIYKMEWEPGLGQTDTRILMLVEVSKIETIRNLERISQMARNDLLDHMKQEISVPLEQLREIITGMSGLKSPGEIQARVESLDKSWSLLANLIDASMDFARQDASSAVTEEIPFCLRSEIDLALEPFRRNNASVSMITKIRNDVPDDLIGDPFRFRQVIGNLVQNALELTNEGRILISSEVIEQRDGHLKLQFHVEDTGEGLSAERIREIMHALDQGEPMAEDPEGLIRHLTITKQQIDLLNGQLWLTSPSTISSSPDFPGLKCSFTMEASTAVIIRENRVFSEVDRFEKVRLLVLSQEKDMDNEKFGPLAALGIDIKHLIYRPENTESLLELVREKAPGLHMILVAHSSKENGMKVAEEIRRKGLAENQVLIVLSSDHRQENYAICRNEGIDHYLEDPYKLYQFADIFAKHFPAFETGVLEKIPAREEINANLRILLAEDNLFNRKVIQGLFKRLGCEIDQAKNGREAVDLEKNNAYDLIFMDLLMPELDGMQAAMEIRRRGSSVPIIALTAVEDEKTRKAAMKAGFNGYLIKPASEENVRKIILQTLSQAGSDQ